MLARHFTTKLQPQLWVLVLPFDKNQNQKQKPQNNKKGVGLTFIHSIKMHWAPIKYKAICIAEKSS